MKNALPLMKNECLCSEAELCSDTVGATVGVGDGVGGL